MKISAIVLLIILSACGGIEIGNKIEDCRGGETCTCDVLGNCLFDCPDGNCHFVCKGTGNCILTCEGGDCDASCQGTGNCTLSCPPGGCTIDCHNTGNCICDEGC